MVYHIALLLKPHILEYCQSVLELPSQDVQVEFFSYETIEEMKQIYRQIHENFDGIITSGIIPHTVIQSLVENHPISASYLHFDAENTYRIILQQSILRNKLDLNRIGLDFLKEGCSFEQVIAHDDLPQLMSELESSFISIPMEQIPEAEAEFVQRYIPMFEQNKIDFVVTAIYSAIPLLGAKGYPCYYIYPSRNTIRRALSEICSKIDLRLAQKSYPAVIRIDLRNKVPDHTDSFELYFTNIKSAILKFVQSQYNNLTLKSGYQQFELYSDYDTITKLTNQFSCCPIAHLLCEKFSFTGTIGYGVGTNFYQARANAIDASDYASRFGDDSCASFLINEKSQLTRLSVNEEAVSSWMINLPSSYIYQTANQVKLSPDTISKIISVLHAESTNEITSSELIARLGISLRTANRFLANLSAYGRAVIVGQRAATGKGRPLNIYRLDLLY